MTYIITYTLGGILKLAGPWPAGFHVTTQITTTFSYTIQLVMCLSIYNYIHL